MKRGSGMKGLVDKSRGIVSLITVTFTNINPREPLRLSRHVVRMKLWIVVYYESIKRELNKRLVFEHWQLGESFFFFSSEEEAVHRKRAIRGWF